MHEQYMNFFKPQKNPPTGTLHRKSEKMNETEWVSKMGLSGEIEKIFNLFQTSTQSDPKTPPVLFSPLISIPPRGSIFSSTP